MHEITSVLIVVGAGACFGFGIRWGFWIWNGCRELLSDLRNLRHRKKP